MVEKELSIVITFLAIAIFGGGQLGDDRGKNMMYPSKNRKHYEKLLGFMIFCKMNEQLSIGQEYSMLY